MPEQPSTLRPIDYNKCVTSKNKVCPNTTGKTKDNIPRQACSFWFARHVDEPHVVANLYLSGFFLLQREDAVFKGAVYTVWTYI